jgi:uncharacterized membrane protein HdeD (DUF308 family)
MTTPLGVSKRLVRAHRSVIVGMAVVGVVLGVVALLWPAATLLTVATVFGSYLVVSGVFRVVVAFVTADAGAGHRWLSVVLGALIVAAGVFCLASPADSLVVLVFVIGSGWIAEGVIDIVAGVRGVVSPGRLAVVSGIVSVIAGLVAFVLPGLAAVAFLTVGAVLLIVVSVTTLLTIPRSNTVAA